MVLRAGTRWSSGSTSDLTDPYVRHESYNVVMSSVTKRDLNQRTSAVLAQAAERGEVIVTERGEPRWRVSAYRGQDGALARAERQGRYTAPESASVPWPETVSGPTYSSEDVDALLDEMKGDH